MKKAIIGKILAFTIVVLFVGMNLVSTVDSVSLKKDVLTDSSKEISIQNNRLIGKERLITKADGLTTLPQETKNRLNAIKNLQNLFGNRGAFYAYIAYDPSGQYPPGWITFDLNGEWEYLSVGIFPNFIACTDIDADGNWYAVDYGGGIYQIFLDGTSIYIAPSIALNGLTFDSTTGVWYGSDTTNLYSFDITTGATTLIGPFNTPNTLIDIACNLAGEIYGYDVLFSGESTLYIINKTTGQATAVGGMGQGFLYAQDNCFDRDNNILYIVGYTQSGTSGFYTCDISTGLVTLIFDFGGIELDALAIPWTFFQYDHDVGVKEIIKPKNGNADALIPKTSVKNFGLNNETNVSVNFRIGKENITGILEDFEETNGGYTHFPKTVDAWEYGTPTSGPMAAHSGSNLWATILGGNYPASMWCSLVTPAFVVPSGAAFSFWHWYAFESSWDGGNVKISNDGGLTYTLITPIGGYPGFMNSNPYMTGQAAYTGTGNGWMKAEFDLSAYEGQLVQIMFETASDPSVQYAGWYIDDVGFVSTSWANEYNQTIMIPIIAPGETLEVEFPEWIPADLGLSENVVINYLAEATNLFADENINNDYIAKPFSLSYSYFNDVKVNAIGSPVSGLASPQTPNATIQNVGQFGQSANVNMVISKIEYGTPWTQESNTEWQQVNSNVAGGIAPEVYLPYLDIQGDYAYLMSCPIDTSAEPALTLSFRSMINDYAGGYNCYVKSRSSESDDWTDVTPWPNPISGSVPAAQYSIDVTDDISTTTQVMFEFSGYYFNLNYWYVDDFVCGAYSTDFSGNFPPAEVSLIPEYDQTVTVDIAAGETMTVVLPLWTPADLPFATTIDYHINASVSMNVSDGNPTDNELVKVISLSYEHDVGIAAITEPSGPPKTGDIIFHQGYWGVDESWVFNTAGAALGFLVQEDFYDLADPIGDVSWWGLSLGNNGGWFETSPDMIYDIIFYEDNAGAPGAVVATFIGLNPDFEDTGLDYNSFSQWKWSITLPEAVELSSGWISIQSEVPADNGNLMWATGPDGNLNALQNGAPLLQNQAYDLGKADEYPPEWPPGTYPVAGIVKNFGVTYTETGFDVNAQITNGTGDVVYDETVTIVDPLAPGATAAVTFPYVTIENNTEGTFKLTMKTLLPGDDHPNNDKKTLIFGFHPPDPPITYAEITGTMGSNYWYVSCVTITLYAYAPEGKWPHGIDHTYYKIDDGEWTEYSVPFSVCEDGQHIVYFYSVDFVGTVEETKSVSFKIDQTAPFISVTTEKVGFRQWKFIADASDAPSGVVQVVCFLDNMLLGNITEPGPYIWNWEGSGNHTVTAVAYDAAGNSAESSVTFSLDLSQNQHQGFSFVRGAMIQMISRIIQILHQWQINGK